MPEAGRGVISLKAAAYLWHVLTEYDVEPIEVYLGLYALVWGLAVGNPWTHTAPVSVTFSILTMFASEWGWGWGLALVLLGLGHLAAVGHRSIRLQRIACMTSAMFWVFIAGLGFWSTFGASPGAAHFLLAGVTAGFTYVRLGQRP